MLHVLSPIDYEIYCFRIEGDLNRQSLVAVKSSHFAELSKTNNSQESRNNSIPLYVQLNTGASILLFLC